MLLATALLLGGCQKPSSIERSEYEQLQTRVAVLEAHVAELSEKRRAEPIAVAAPPPAPAAPRRQEMTYQLIGASFKDQDTFRYATRERCEAAQQALLDNWAAEDERNRARGVVFTSRPTPTCLPL